MKKLISVSLAIVLLFSAGYAQPCTPLGDQTSYGSNDTWLGYVYDNQNFTGYSGYVNQGTAGNPNFDQSFGGDDVNYPTNGCPVFTSTFSVRYKLNKTFSNGVYDFIVGADDGYRLSLDGGTTWVIDRYFDQGYNTTGYSATLNGNYNMVLEFYENGGGNRVSFSVSPGCTGSENQSVYGTNDVWRGYVYDGTAFNSYKGMVQEGSLGIVSFDQSFGGSNTNYSTSSCAVQTETFSVRYRLNKTFAFGSYTFIAGGDDGYRLSLNGGATWVIDRWNDQSYNTASYTSNLSGNYDMVLEFFENGGDNRISLELQANLVLKINLLSFSGLKEAGSVQLNWDISADSDPSRFEIQRSADGISFQDIQTIAGSAGNTNAGKTAYHFTDINPLTGRSFYRLKMTDQSGITTYSQVVLIAETSIAAGELQIFPTIVTGGSFFCRAGRALQEVTVSIIDINGRVIYTQSAAGMSRGQSLTISPTRLISGVYLVRIANKGVPLKTERILVP